MNKLQSSAIKIIFLSVLLGSCTKEIEIKATMESGLVTFSFWKNSWLREHHRTHLDCIQLITVFSSDGRLLWRIDRDGSQQCFGADAVSYGAKVEGYEYYFSREKLKTPFTVNVLSSEGSGTARF